MMKEWNKVRIAGVLFGLASLACILISIFENGNNMFLNIGLLCVCVDLILFYIDNKSGK